MAAPVALLVLRGTLVAGRAAAVLFALAGVSDLLDGHVARTAGQTALGRQLDPLADKLLTDVTLVALAATERVPAPLVAVLVGRDVLVTALRVSSALAPSPAARLKTALLYGSVTALLGSPEGTGAARGALAGLVVAVGLALLSAWEYATQR